MLIGREAELDRIAVARAAPGARGLVVRAPAGTGKTALARAAAEAARRDGSHVEWVMATRSAATVPLAALAGMLMDVELTSDPFERLVRGAQALADRAGRRRALLVVDDGQHLDAASAALILHIATSETAFVLTTVRSDEPCPDAVEALWKDAGAPQLELEPLSARATRALAEAQLDGPVEERLAAWLFDSCQGNAMLARELVSGALADSAIGRRDGLWILERQPAPSASLIELVGRGLSDLSSDERRALELLALGEPLAPGLLDEEALMVLEERRYVTVDRAAARVAHPLYAEVTRAKMTSLRIYSTLRRLAELVPDDGTPETALRRTRWLLDAGEPVPETLLVNAADAALEAGDPAVAADLARRAVDRGAGTRPALILGRALWLDGRPEDAETILAGLEGHIDDLALAARYVDLRTLVLVWALHAHEEAADLLARASGWWDTPDWERALRPVQTYLPTIIEVAAPIESAEALFTAAATSAAARTSAGLAYARALHWNGQSAYARRVLRSVLPAGPSRTHHDLEAMAVFAISATDTGHDLIETEAWARSVIERDRSDAPNAAAMAATALGRIASLEGRFVDARRWFAEAASQYRRQDVFGAAVRVQASQVYVGYMLDEGEDARDRLRVDTDLAGVAPTMRPYVRQGQAWAAMAVGDPRAAQQLALDSAEEPGVPALAAAELAYDALRMGAPARIVASRIAAVRERTDAPLVAAWYAHAVALDAKDGRALMDAATVFEGIGARRYACECAAAAAHRFAEEGREDSARRATAFARSSYTDGRPPQLSWAGAESVELTRREAQLADLAADGLSNLEIANQLVLSVRTVESHLYSAMRKLGVTSRNALRSHRAGTDA